MLPIERGFAISDSVATEVKLGSCAIVCVVLLRLAMGWHFYSEGTKKLKPGFSSAPFLRQATGPLAPLYHREVPGGYGWQEQLARPLGEALLSADEQAENAAWAAQYRRATTVAERAGQPLPAEFPPHAPVYDDWASAIVQAWGQVLKRFRDLPQLSEEERDEAQLVFDRWLRQLADYLAENESAIEDYRHELGRIEQWSAGAETGSLPFHDERIAKAQAAASASALVWVREVNQLGESYSEDLLSLLTPEKRDQLGDTARTAVTDPQILRLRQIDKGVTWWLILVGGGLLLGLFTPLAAVAGAVFLLTVMASQPPWVTGAETTYLGYQLVELTALLTLAAIGAGRWGGLDMFLYSLGGSCCRQNGTCVAEEAPR